MSSTCGAKPALLESPCAALAGARSIVGAHSSARRRTSSLSATHTLVRCVEHGDAERLEQLAQQRDVRAADRRVCSPYARSHSIERPRIGDAPASARRSARSVEVSPSGASDIGVPAGGAFVLAHDVRATDAREHRDDASAKSASSVAAQNTGAHGMPVAASIASASASALIALLHV